MANEKKTVDPYLNKAIRFFDKGNFYELVFIDDFGETNGSNPVITDVLIDLKNADKNKELHIFIASYGGYVNCLTLLLQQILLFSHVVTICTSNSDSCGFLLWCAGHERYCSPFSTFLHHSASVGIFGKLQEIKNAIEPIEKISNILEKSLGIDKILTPEELERSKTTEVFFTGAQLISRKVALPYSEYQERQIPILIPKGVYQFNENLLAKQNEDGIFELYGKAGIKFSYNDFLDMINGKRDLKEFIKRKPKKKVKNG